MAITINDEVIIDDCGNFNQQGFINHIIETAKLLGYEEKEEDNGKRDTDKNID